MALEIEKAFHSRKIGELKRLLNSRIALESAILTLPSGTNTQLQLVKTFSF